MERLLTQDIYFASAAQIAKLFNKKKHFPGNLCSRDSSKEI